MRAEALLHCWLCYRQAAQVQKKEIIIMTINRYLRLIAGFFIMLSVALSQLHSPYWLFFTAFVGLNLFQSAFSNWCPMITFLRKLGVKEG
jgi:hypothetical protein